MQTERAKPVSSQWTMGHLILLLGIIALWCVHIYAIWSGTLYYILTRMTLFPVIVLLFIAILRNSTGGQEVERKFSFSRYSTALLLSLIFSVCFIITPLPNYIKALGIRHRIQTVSDEVKLQAWAEKILQMPLDKLPVKQHMSNIYYLDDTSFPEYVRRIPIGKYRDYSYRLIDEGTRGRYLEIDIWHGRPDIWGILICPPSHNPPRLENRWIQKWKPGLYSWQQLNTVS